MAKKLIVLKSIENRIFTIRNQKIMIDRDLAELYEVETKRLNEAVKRNIARFPKEFMFKLSVKESSELITNCNRFKILKHSSSTPYAFTEHGILMLSSVLNSEKAIKVNVQIMKIFVKMRQHVLSQSDNSVQISELRRLLLMYMDKNDKRVNEIIIILNNLIAKPPETKRIGFGVN